MNAPVVDWEALRKYGPQNIECRCGFRYRSLFKLVSHLGGLVSATETPCPACGNAVGHVRAARSGPETWSLEA